MKTTNQCSECGAEIDSRSKMPCPACLMKLGMQSWGTPSPSLDSPSISDVPVTMDQSTGGFDAKVASIIESQFPGLEILGLLGQGGMGMVFKARQTSLDRVVAIKVIRSDTEHREAFEIRFSREARALASLNHPNIVTVHDFGKTENYFFLMMEFVDGVNIRDLLAGQKITPREALEIIPQVCDALQYAHDQGVVHRDIKPENILLDKNGRVKIADYGLAKLVNAEATSPSLTRTNHVMGTPHYMAPEQVEKPLTVDHRADIYSLGVVIYEMLTGELPLGRFAPPSEKVEVDVRLDQIVLQTLEKEPGLRYQRVSEVKTDFQSVASSQNARQKPADNANPNSQQAPVYTAAAQVPIQTEQPNPYGGTPSQFESQNRERQNAASRNAPVNDAYRQQQVGAQKPHQPQQAFTNSPAANQAYPQHANPQHTILQHAYAQNPNAAFNHPYGDQGISAKPIPKNPPPIFSGIFHHQTYLNALYLLLSFPMGLALFIVTVVGVSAGIPTMIIWIGFFILFGAFFMLRSLLAVERGLVQWLLGESIVYRNPVGQQATMMGKFKTILQDRSTWWGVLYSLVNFPWSILCFVVVITFFAIPLFLLAGPILFTQWYYEVNIGSFEIDSLPKAIVAAILGFPIFYVGMKITNVMAFCSRKMSAFFLTRM